DLGRNLDQLRDGLPTDPAGAEAPPEAEAETERRPAAEPPPPPGSAYATSVRDTGPEGHGSLLSRVGSAEWNLLTDAVTWSDELYQIFGRDPEEGGLPLDELPSWVFSEDQPTLTALV
ncbi:phosphatase, partial [Streptomyces sp. MCAF7]